MSFPRRPVPVSLQSDAPSVLIVDDEQDNLDTFQRVFRKTYRMCLHTSPPEALAHARTAAFDVGLIDFAMPRMDGIALCEHLRSLQPDMGLIMVTAHDDLPVVRAALRDGLVATVLPKPWDRATISRWVEHAQRIRAMRSAVAAMRTRVAG